MAKEIRNRQKLKYGIGDLVYINHSIAKIKKQVHAKITKHLHATSLIIKIVEKKDFDSWHNEYSYFVYEVLVGSEKLEFSEDVLSDSPIDTDDIML